MKICRLIICCTILTLLLLTLTQTVLCQDYIEYKVQIEQDGSAVWSITQVSDANATVDTWEQFQQKIFTLIESAANLTHREMTVDENSLLIDNSISSGSKTTQYIFVWLNFSQINNEELTFGDVFGVKQFFEQLFGEAKIEFTYPDGFNVKSAVPEPQEQNQNLRTLTWLRTQDLSNADPNITLQVVSNGNQNARTQPMFLIILLAVAITLSFAGFFLFKRSKRNSKTPIAPQNNQTMLTDEEKILGIIKNAGGTIRQSDITEQSRFSKAKTSQLLSELEKKALVARYKKGRDKIVTINQRSKK